MKRSSIGPGAKALARGSSFANHGDGLKRNASSLEQRPGQVKARAGTLNKRRAVSPASEAQRSKIRGRICLVCGEQPVHPSHVIDRSMGGGDLAVEVVPLCPIHHRDYDEGRLSLLEHLEPHYRDELAHAVRLVGLITALQRITNERWAPERRDVA